VRLPGKAAFKSALLRYSGISAWRWRQLPQGLYCFNYHRIGDRDRTPYDPNVFSCSTERFTEQAHFLKRNFDMISLAQLEDIVANGKRPHGRLGLITFDDGYLDNHQNALPVLLEEGLSAVFFVSTDLIGDTAIPWWDQVAWWVRHCRTYTLQFSDQTLEINTETTEATAGSIRRVLTALKSDPRPLHIKLGELESRLGPDRPMPQSPGLFMGWAELKSLLANGMAVGSHTCGHQILSHLPAEAQACELQQSRQIIQDQLGTSVHSLAYPVGSEASFNEDTLEQAKAAGYRLAFTFTNSINPLPIRNRLTISRLGIDGDLSAGELQRRIALTKPLGAGYPPTQDA